MVIRDLYLLQRSDDFHLLPRQEAQIDLALVKITPVPNTALSGLVLGVCGPLAKATVKVLRMDNAPLMHTVTDKNGFFSFKNMLPAGDYRVLATADRYRVSGDYHVSLLPNRPKYMILRLEYSALSCNATVYGMVRDNSGAALSDVEIRIYDLRCTKKMAACSRSNSDGEYLVYGLKPGKYQIMAQKSGYVFPQPATFQCLPNDILPLDLFLYVDGCLQNGTVSGEIKCQGKPVPHGVAALYREEDGGHRLIAVKEANDEGIYLFDHVPPGEYLVKAKLEGQRELICEEKITD